MAQPLTDEVGEEIEGEKHNFADKFRERSKKRSGGFYKIPKFFEVFHFRDNYWD
jgi:hypothetical protein